MCGVFRMVDCYLTVFARLALAVLAAQLGFNTQPLRRFVMFLYQYPAANGGVVCFAWSRT